MIKRLLNYSSQGRIGIEWHLTLQHSACEEDLLQQWLHDSVSWAAPDSSCEQSRTSGSTGLLGATVLTHWSWADLQRFTLFTIKALGQTESTHKYRWSFGLRGWSVDRSVWGNTLNWTLPTVGACVCSLSDQSSLIAAPLLIPLKAAAGVERFSLRFNKYLYILGHFIIPYSA